MYTYSVTMQNNKLMKTKPLKLVGYFLYFIKAILKFGKCESTLPFPIRNNKKKKKNNRYLQYIYKNRVSALNIKRQNLMVSPYLNP